MEKVRPLVLTICVYLFISDVFNAFSSASVKHHKSQSHSHHAHLHEVEHIHSKPRVSNFHVDEVDGSVPILQEPPQFPRSKPSALIGGQAHDAVVHISFCTSCSYRGQALTIKKMLESAFPGITVVLSNYPPPLPKRLLSKLVPVLQIGSVVLVTAGDHIFPRLGYTVPPLWYYSLKQKKFAVIASTWLIGNSLQSFLQSTGAFEVECNGRLVFSKLHENRFPGELELRELIFNSLGFQS